MLSLFEQLNKQPKVVLKRVHISQSDKKPSSYSIDLIPTSAAGEMPKIKLWRKPETKDDSQPSSNNKEDVASCIPERLKRKVSSESDTPCDRPKKPRTEDDSSSFNSHSRKESRKEKRQYEKTYSDVDKNREKRIKDKKRLERRTSTEKNRESDKERGNRIYKKKKDKKRSREQDWPVLERSDIERPRAINHSEMEKQIPTPKKEKSPPVLQPVLETRSVTVDSRLSESAHLSGTTTDEDVAGNGCEDIERPDSAMTVALNDVCDVSQVSISDAETDELVKSPREEICSPEMSNLKETTEKEILSRNPDSSEKLATDVGNPLPTEKLAASTAEGCETQPSSPVSSLVPDPQVDRSAVTPPRLAPSTVGNAESSGSRTLISNEVGVIKAHPFAIISSPSLSENGSLAKTEEEDGSKSEDSPQQETCLTASVGHDTKSLEDISKEEVRCNQTIARVRQQLQQINNERKLSETETLQLKEEINRLEKQKMTKEEEMQKVVSDASKLLKSVDELKEERDRFKVAVVDANKCRFETELKLREYQTEVCQEKLKTDWSKNVDEYTTQWLHLKEKEERICHLSIEVDNMIEAADKAIKNQSLAEERYLKTNNEYLKMKQTLELMTQDIDALSNNISIIKKRCQDRETHLSKLSERRREERLMLVDLEKKLVNIGTAKKLFELERKKKAIDEMDSDDDILEVTPNNSFSDVKLEKTVIAASSDSPRLSNMSVSNATNEDVDRDATPPLTAVASSVPLVETGLQQQQQKSVSSQTPASTPVAPTAQVAPLIIHPVSSPVSVVQNTASNHAVVPSLSQSSVDSVGPRNESVPTGLTAVRLPVDRGNVNPQGLTPASFAHSPDSLSISSIASSIPFFVQFVIPSSVSNVLDEDDLCQQIVRGCAQLYNLRNRFRNLTDHRMIMDCANLAKDFIIPLHRLASLKDLQLPNLVEWIAAKAQESNWYNVGAMDAPHFAQLMRRTISLAMDLAAKYRDVKFSEMADRNLSLTRGRAEFIPPTSSSLATFIIHPSTASWVASAQFSPSESSGGLGNLVNAQNRNQGLPVNPYHEAMQRPLPNESQMQHMGGQRLTSTGWRNERAAAPPMVTYPQRPLTAPVPPMSVQHRLASHIPIIPNTPQWSRTQQQLHQSPAATPFNQANLRSQAAGRQIVYATSHYGHFQQQQTREQIQQQQLIHQNREVVQVTQNSSQLPAPYQGTASATAATSAATVAAPAAFTCLKCSKRADQRCGGCSNAYYCSKQCQVDHWDEHVRSCSQR